MLQHARRLRARASSPTRTRNDLESAVPKIICRMFTTGMAMREDVQSLRQKLMEAARHRGILPFSLKVRELIQVLDWVGGSKPVKALASEPKAAKAAYWDAVERTLKTAPRGAA